MLVLHCYPNVHITVLTTGLGYPIATVPLGLMESNDQPYGFFVVARANEEKKLLAFMSAFEAMFLASKTPPRLS
jgi:amidase